VFHTDVSWWHSDIRRLVFHPNIFYSSIVRNGETEREICCSHTTYTIVDPARDTELRSVDFDLRVIWFSERVETQAWFSTSTFKNWSSVPRLIAFRNFAHVGARFNGQITSFAKYENISLGARIIIGELFANASHFGSEFRCHFRTTTCYSSLREISRRLRCISRDKGVEREEFPLRFRQSFPRREAHSAIQRSGRRVRSGRGSRERALSLRMKVRRTS